MVMDMHLGLLRLFIRRTDTGEFRNLTLPSQLIKTLGVTLLGNRNGDINEDLNEGQTSLLARSGDLMQLARGITVCTVGRDERCDGDGGAVGEELGDLCDATDILGAVLLAEAEILIKPEANVVTVETIGVDAPVSEELVLELDGNGGLARGGETGEPNRETALVADFATFAARQGAGVEGDVSFIVMLVAAGWGWRGICIVRKGREGCLDIRGLGCHCCGGFMVDWMRIVVLGKKSN